MISLRLTGQLTLAPRSRILFLLPLPRWERKEVRVPDRSPLILAFSPACAAGAAGRRKGRRNQLPDK